MEINRHLDDQIDTLDATLFTGDCMIEECNRVHLREMMERWERQLQYWEELAEEIKADV